jgi:hypothetical protein
MFAQIYLTPDVYSNLDQFGKTAAVRLGGLIRYLNNAKFRGRKYKHRDAKSNGPTDPIR